MLTWSRLVSLNELVLKYFNFGDTKDNIDMNKNIHKTQATFMSNCNKKTNELANNYVQKILNISRKETNRKLNFLSELKEIKKSYVKNIVGCHLNVNSFKNKLSSINESLPLMTVSRLLSFKSMATNVCTKIGTSWRSLSVHKWGYCT